MAMRNVLVEVSFSILVSDDVPIENIYLNIPLDKVEVKAIGFNDPLLPTPDVLDYETVDTVILDEGPFDEA